MPIAVARIIAITQGRTPEIKALTPAYFIRFLSTAAIKSIITKDGRTTPSVPSDIQPFNSEKIFYCISVQILVFSLFSVYPQHTVTDADMRLNVLRTVLLRLQLFAQGRHKHPQRSNIVFPAAAPNLLCDIGVRQHLSDIMREQTQKLIFNRGQVQFLPI